MVLCNVMKVGMYELGKVILPKLCLGAKESSQGWGFGDLLTFCLAKAFLVLYSVLCRAFLSSISVL